MDTVEHSGVRRTRTPSRGPLRQFSRFLLRVVAVVVDMDTAEAAVEVAVVAAVVAVGMAVRRKPTTITWTALGSCRGISGDDPRGAFRLGLISRISRALQS